MSEISKEVVLLIIADLERQLASSAENSVAGRMIVQQAVCAAFAERYLETPSTVAPMLSAVTIGLNNATWSSDFECGKGMRRLAIAQLGTAKDFDSNRFLYCLAGVLVRKWLPRLLRHMAEFDKVNESQFLQAANRVALDGSFEAVRSAVLCVGKACLLVDSENGLALVGEMFVQLALCAASAADNSKLLSGWCLTAGSENDSCTTKAMTYLLSRAIGLVAAQSGDAIGDELLSEFAEDVVVILATMKTPGSKFLYLAQSTKVPGVEPADLLGRFNYLTQAVLPEELVQFLNADKRATVWHCENTLAWTSVFFCGNEALRTYLVNKGGYADGDQILRLYVYSKACYVYFDSTGKRLGAHLKIYDWMGAAAA